jgi:predicted nucleic acid-binding protein
VSLVVLDTDVASASLRDRPPGQLRAALAGHKMCITFITVFPASAQRSYSRPADVSAHVRVRH